MATNSSILAWKIPEELAGYCLWGRRESDMTECTQTQLLCSSMLHENIYISSSVDGYLSCSQFFAFCFEFIDFLKIYLF